MHNILASQTFNITCGRIMGRLIVGVRVREVYEREELYQHDEGTVSLSIGIKGKIKIE